MQLLFCMHLEERFAQQPDFLTPFTIKKPDKLTVKCYRYTLYVTCKRKTPRLNLEFKLFLLIYLEHN